MYIFLSALMLLRPYKGFLFMQYGPFYVLFMAYRDIYIFVYDI